jgi:hypothetical protein
MNSQSTRVSAPPKHCFSAPSLADTAVSNYRFVVTFTGRNLEVHCRFWTTNVWVKRGGRWQIVAAHMAFVLDPKQAAMLEGGGSAR